MSTLGSLVVVVAFRRRGLGRSSSRNMTLCLRLYNPLFFASLPAFLLVLHGLLRTRYSYLIFRETSFYVRMGSDGPAVMGLSFFV